MPRPAEGGPAYRPGLDGVRAIAVAAVIAYHLGAPWLPGGLMGVGVFFTLSGYLITSILVSRWDRFGSLRLGSFWMARARRLLPALGLVLVSVLIAAALVTPDEWGARGWESLTATFYVANWAEIYGGEGYFAAQGGLGPLDHLWSLSVEEQFYLLWPLALWGLLLLTRGRSWRVALSVLGVAAASFVWMGILAEPGLDNTRAYQGTDARAGALLLGGALAVLWRGGVMTPQPRDFPAKRRWRARRTGLRTRAIAGTRRAVPEARAAWWLDAIGGAGLVAVIALMMTLDDLSLALYHGGLFALAVATMALVAAAAHPHSQVGRALGVAPLRWLGERSYGIYLWHLPVILFMPEDLLASAPWARAPVAIAMTLTLAAMSWRYVEDPIRTRGFRTAFGFDSPRTAIRRASAATGVVAVALVGAGAMTFTTPVAAGERIVTAQPYISHPTNAGFKAVWIPVDWPTVSAGLIDAPPHDQALDSATSCKAVLYVGDSTSLGVINSKTLPNPEDRLGPQLERVGVAEIRVDILGARSIVERYQGQPNAAEAVAAAIADGFEGCFIVAMGLNEAANVAVGGRVGLTERIERIMTLTDGSPTMWATVRTQRDRGPWAQVEMAKMNAALIEACRHHGNMRVYDWAGELRPEWFGPDRIHYTSEGDRQHALRTADALAAAFPAVGPQIYQCLVSSGRDEPN